MVATFGYASAIVVLPVSLFGMSISAAKLPEMSTRTGTRGGCRLSAGEPDPRTTANCLFRHSSAAAFLAFGDVIAALLFQRGKFTRRFAYAWGFSPARRSDSRQYDGSSLLSTITRCTIPRRRCASRGARHTHHTARLPVCAVAAAAHRNRRTLGRGLTHRPASRAGLSFTAALAAQPAHWTTAFPRVSSSLWTSAIVGALAGWEMRGLVQGRGHVLAGVLVLGTYGVVFFS